jgi:hypothetical protein
MTVAAALIAESLELDNGTFTILGEHDVSEDGKDSIWRWHLHDEIGVVGYGLEHGEHVSSEDSMV